MQQTCQIDAIMGKIGGGGVAMRGRNGWEVKASFEWDLLWKKRDELKENEVRG